MMTTNNSALRRTAAGIIAGALLFSRNALAEKPSPGWSLKAKEAPVELAGFLGALDLSGIAKTGNHVLVVSDELTGVQTGTLNEAGGSITFASAINLVTAEPAEKKGKKKEKAKKSGGEIDMEGICYDSGEKAFYVTGSHGVGKKKGDFQPLRYGVYRIPVDPESGTMRAAEVTRSSLLPWLETSEQFKAYVRQPLQQNGFNVEGLASANGRLYFGVRGPNIDGSACIIEVGANELFQAEGAGIQPKVHLIPTGPDKGIRELVAVTGGFLMLTGNASAEATKQFPQSIARRPDTGFTLSFLPSPGPGNIGKPEPVGDVSAADGKAEGLLVLKDADGSIELLVLHDGLEQGGATAFTVQRPAAPKNVASEAK